MNGEPEKPQRPETIVNYAGVPKRKSTNDLVGTVYHELKGLANRMMANERPGHTLQATALVHEAYVRLTDQDTPKWDSKAHFYGAAALAMRRILVARARSRNGSGWTSTRSTSRPRRIPLTGSPLTRR